jgi:flagellar basal-body rod protein FlgB
MAGSASVGLIEYLETALRASSLRSKVIANNIANIGTEGFRRSTVDFEQLLGEAMGSRRPGDLADVSPVLQQPMTTAVNEYGSDVDLDAEFGEMVKNTVKEKTYMRLLIRTYRQADQAMQTSG